MIPNSLLLTPDILKIPVLFHYILYKEMPMASPIPVLGNIGHSLSITIRNQSIYVYSHNNNIVLCTSSKSSGNFFHNALIVGHARD